ncbi:hypothetical protein JKP88DRAFT_285475 [Tribonema minus]|uniref:Uncharacterized protein n=1 Tax=Tribonema minus TaxID=303371 RepID=A0A836CMX4_9STRA|nr:hypothetical protein JKP88DRAFT_285475 [Tribonema minus]
MTAAAAAAMAATAPRAAAWFDAQGRAITRMAIRLRADDLPHTCITGSSEGQAASLSAQACAALEAQALVTDPAYLRTHFALLLSL